MDEKALNTLEFPKVLERLARYTTLPVAAERKANPKAVRDELQRQLEQRNLEGETTNG